MKHLSWSLGFLWLSIVVLIISGGGVRLMEAGLSIVEWNVVVGIIPPLSREAWQEVFARYQQTEQFTRLFHHMHIEDFKTIFWWEWGHRFLARCIALLYVVIVFFGRIILRREWQITKWVILSGALFLLQGLVGWWMVRSGLEGEAIFVSPARLGIHMLMAFAVLGTLFRAWMVCLASPRDHEEHDKNVKRKFLKSSLSPYFLLVLCGLFLAQVFLGVLNAGEHHRFLYGSWEIFWQKPFLALHGCFAILLCVGVFFQLIHSDKMLRVPIYCLLGCLILQSFLGVGLIVISWEHTILLLLAWLHQGIAVGIWLCLLWMGSMIVDIKPRE